MKPVKRFEPYWREIMILILILATLCVWSVVWQRGAGKTLKVYFLDVGQGDAIFIETPSRHQVLVDGGKNRKVVSELGRIMRFGDKTIDVVMATHPDADHIGGLPEVVDRYEIGLFIEPVVEETSDLNNVLHNQLENEKVQILPARRGQTISFGDGVTLTILFPDRDVSQFETNDASVVAKLTYGESDFLLTGDAGIKTENILLNLNPIDIDVEVLKAGHHGSRTSTSLPFAEAVTPLYSIISAGKDNTYGHPHQQVLETLREVGSEIVSTIESGTIKFETDGRTLDWRR